MTLPEYDCYQKVPTYGYTADEGEIMERAKEAAEEEYARLSRQAEDLRFAGKVKAAEEIEAQLEELEQLLDK